MKYEIKIPALLGDVIPLYFVADAMAGAASTAFGKTPPHKPIYDEQLPVHIKSLVDDARTGKLVVCNSAGYQCTVVEIIAAAKKSETLQEPRRYAVESDWDKAYANRIHSKLHCLNEWGKPRGDEFSIAAESAAWVDERGYMNPKAAVADVCNLASNEASMHGEPPGKMPNVASRKMAIKAAWQIECETKRAASAKDVMSLLQTWADSGTEPESLIKSNKAKNGVIWITTKGKEILFDLNACEKALKTWNGSRQ